MTSLIQVNGTHATVCSGVRSASSFQTGLPSRRAHRSQSAFTTAAVAMWTMPRSGPIQRSCGSWVSRW